MAEPKNKSDSYGSCNFATQSPPAIDANTKMVNLVLSFEDVLKLNLAIDSAAHALGRVNRSDSAGKREAVTLIVDFEKKRVRVHKGRLPK